MEQYIQKMKKQHITSMIKKLYLNESMNEQYNLFMIKCVLCVYVGSTISILIKIVRSKLDKVEAEITRYLIYLNFKTLVKNVGKNNTF